MSSPDPLAKEQLQRYNSLKGVRDGVFLPGWQQITDYFLPQQSNVNTQKTEGTTGWTDRIYDSTGIQAAQTLRSGQCNWLTPSAETWAEFEPPETLNAEGRENDRDEAAQWLSKCTDITMRELARSNFYSMASLDYLQVATTGTGSMFAEEGKKTSLNFRQFKCWHITAEENDEGIVDTVHREFELTTRQAIQWFGYENVGEKIQKSFDARGGAQLSKKWKFLHACFPREDSKRIKGRMDGPNKPFASVYIAVDDILCVQVSGYDEMPYFVSRFDKWGTDCVWGYSPAYLCLPDARQINYISQYIDALSELKAYPRILYPSSLEGDIDLRPGGATPFDEDKPNAVPREWMTVGDSKSAEETMLRKADAINKAYYVNMFTMLEQLADKRMTAYEIAQRLGEKLEQFKPVLDRRVSEFLNPLLKRVFGILYRQGKFGKPPACLMNDIGDGKQGLMMPEIAITSRISLALKALHNRGMESTMQGLMPMFQLKPEMMDNFDMDAWTREYARNNGVPPDLLRNVKKMLEIRAVRAKQMQEQKAVDMAQGIAKAGKDLNRSPDEMKDAAMKMIPQQS